MEDLKRELDALIARLATGDGDRDSAAAGVLPFLKKLQFEMENDRSPLGLVPAMSALRQYWLASVAWCSRLSRDIEKIITIHEELVESAAVSSAPDE